MSEIFNWKLQFEEDAVTDNSVDYLVDCASRAHQKASKYFELADKTPMVFAAVVLDPTVKNRWFEEQWSEGSEEQQAWPLDVMNKVKTLWKSEYKRTTAFGSSYSHPRTSSSSNARSGAAPPDQEQSIEETSLQRLANFKRIKLTPANSSIDALNEYLLQDVVPIDDDSKFDVLSWWFDRRHSQPELSKMAFDSLAIPLMSDDNERSFSAGRDLITYRRNRLQSTLIEACLCLRQSYGPPTIRDDKGDKLPAFDDERAIENDYIHQQELRQAAEA
jgi:hypothetical protein